MAWRFLIRLLSSILFLGLIISSSVDAGKKKPPGKPVNVKTATSQELQQGPGIGPATAEKILQMRKSYGAFKSVDDLLAIRGLGPKRLEKMRKYLTVGKTSKAPPQSGPPATPKLNSPASTRSPARSPSSSTILAAPPPRNDIESLSQGIETS